MALHSVGDRLSPWYGWRDVYSDKPVHPSGGRLGGVGSDAMREIALRLLKRRPIAECSVDVIGPVWIGKWIHVDLHRLKQPFGWARDLAMDRLAADDHEFVEPDSVGGGPDDVAELVAAQLPDLREDLAALGLRKRAGEG